VGSGGAYTGGKVGSGGAYTGGKVGSGGAYTGGKVSSGGSVSGGTTGTGGSLTGGKTGTGGSLTGGFGGIAGTGGFGGAAGAGGTSAVPSVVASCNAICDVTSGNPGLTCYGVTTSYLDCWYLCVAYANPAMGMSPELIAEYTAAMVCTAKNMTSLSDYACSDWSALGNWTYSKQPTLCDAAMCQWTCDDIYFGMGLSDYGLCSSMGGRCSCC
jgi:hypothetical protein